jgi:hypothetical protein
MTKHYIRLDQNGTIIHRFSTDFEQPIQGDICVNENGERQYNLDLYDKRGLFKWAWNGQLVAANLDFQIDKLKELHLAGLDQKAQTAILMAYPISKQLNIHGLGYNKTAGGNYLVADQDKMRQDIDSIRTKLAGLEEQVNAATSAAQVEALTW